MTFRVPFIAFLLLASGCSVDRSGLARPSAGDDLGLGADLGALSDGGHGGNDLGHSVDTGTPPDMPAMAVDLGGHDLGPPDLGPPDLGVDAGCAVGGCMPGLVCGASGTCDMPPPPCGGDGAACCGGSTCDTSLTCGPHGTCEACNSTGAGCCNDGSNYCDGPYVCIFDVGRFANDCQHCGAHFEPCCPGDVCDSGYSCMGLLRSCR